MKRIALTGGFGTGKSTVAKMFEERGIPCIDADQAVHELLADNASVKEQVLTAFGNVVLNKSREIDRYKLGNIVFKDPALRKKLEAILHPKVASIMDWMSQELANQGYPMVLLEIPLLFEAGWEKGNLSDVIVVVSSRPEIQLERMKMTRHLSEEEIQDRIHAQLPLAEKEKRADFVIENNGNLEALEQEVEALIQKLR
ncbi:MAG: dephospho-CoA kinase [Deltaproteobacteria bacterium]|nr:dephospho-CoA kinase [Deltaproteobacteria bacterium]